MKISIFKSKWDLTAQVQECNLYDAVREPLEMYAKSDKLITTSIFYKNNREVGNPVIETPALWLDFDDGNFFLVCEQIEKNNCNFAAYTTFSHTPQHNRFRVIIPCLGLTPSNYASYSAYFCLKNNLKPDVTCRQAGRVYYPPIKKPNAPYLYAEAGNRSDLYLTHEFKSSIPADFNKSKAQDGLNEVVLANACFQLSKMTENRNNRLYAIAFKFALTDISRAVISKQLYDAAKKAGLTHSEILGTIRSAFAKAQMTSTQGKEKIDEIFR